MGALLRRTASSTIDSTLAISGTPSPVHQTGYLWCAGLPAPLRVCSAGSGERQLGPLSRVSERGRSAMPCSAYAALVAS